jgi:hypothetical protein
MSFQRLDEILRLVIDDMRNRHKYPSDWEEISLSVRQAAGWSCQKCGKPCRRAGESVSEFLARSPNLPAVEVRTHPIRWCLTVAHLNHIESDCRSENLAAMCAPCHLKYDAAHHALSRKANRMKALEQSGQLNLFV